jgi:hypothetical protein
LWGRTKNTGEQVAEDRGVLGGVGEVVEGAVGDEAAALRVLEALDGDLALEHPALVLGDEVHVGAERVEGRLQLREHGAGNLGDHGQAPLAADVAAHGGLAGGVGADEVDAHARPIAQRGSACQAGAYNVTYGN